MIMQRGGKGGIKERSNRKKRKDGGKYGRKRGDIVMSLVICQNHW